MGLISSRLVGTIGAMSALVCRDVAIAMVAEGRRRVHQIMATPWFTMAGDA
jgi:hypothetical protein